MLWRMAGKKEEQKEGVGEKEESRREGGRRNERRWAEEQCGMA